MKHSLIPYSQPDGCSNLAHDPRFMMRHCLPRGVQLALAICENEKNAPSAASVEAARAALDAEMLSLELVDMLIERVLIFPGNRIEIVWKVAGFAYSMPEPELESFVAI